MRLVLNEPQSMRCEKKWVIGGERELVRKRRESKGGLNFECVNIGCKAISRYETSSATKFHLAR